jgi:hypothetical protein
VPPPLSNKKRIDDDLSYLWDGSVWVRLCGLDLGLEHGLERFRQLRLLDLVLPGIDRALELVVPLAPFPDFLDVFFQTPVR